MTDTVPNAINGEGLQKVPLQNIPIFSIKSCPELNSNVEATSLQDISTNEISSAFENNDLPERPNQFHPQSHEKMQI